MSDAAENVTVQVRGLRKSYGDVEAVAGVDLDLYEGEVLALLGPNGAGKTTIVEILEGQRKRTSGDVSVLGFDPEHDDRSFRERIGVVPQQAGIEPALSVREALALYSAAYPHPRDPDEVIELVGLKEKRDARFETLSGGQKRRLDLGLGIVGGPELIFLDEPTTGFDPSARRRSWSVIDGLRSLGTTILLTTHYMDEAQNLADRVVVVTAGRIVAEGTPDTIAGRDVATAVVSFLVPAGITPEELPLPTVEVERTDGRISFHTETPTQHLAPLIGWAAERGRELDGLTITRPTLEDVYLQLTDREAS